MTNGNPGRTVVHARTATIMDNGKLVRSGINWGLTQLTTESPSVVGSGRLLFWGTEYSTVTAKVIYRGWGELEEQAHHSEGFILLPFPWPIILAFLSHFVSRGSSTFSLHLNLSYYYKEPSGCTLHSCTFWLVQIKWNKMDKVIVRGKNTFWGGGRRAWSWESAHVLFVCTKSLLSCLI